MNKKEKPLLKKLTPFFIAATAFGLIIFRLVVIPAKKIVVSAHLAFQSAKEVGRLIKNQDIVRVDDKLKETRIYLEATQKGLKTLAWTKRVPFLGNYYQDVEHLTNAAVYGIDAGNIMIAVIKPHTELLGLEGEGSFIMGSAEERIEKIVKIMAKVTPKASEIEKKLELVKKEVDQVNPNRYPPVIFGKKIYPQIILAKEIIDQSYFILSKAKPFIVNLPRLLGEPSPKRYLLLFQNDKELRSTNELFAVHASFRLRQGKIYLEGSDYIYPLDRDSTAKENSEKLYNYIRGRGVIDGVIAIDTHTLVEIITVLGPIDLYGTRFTTNLNPKCNCPQVIFELENYASRSGGYVGRRRRNLFGLLANAVIQKALALSPRLYWGKFFQTISEEFNQKHLLIYFSDEEVQKGIEALESMSANTD